MGASGTYTCKECGHQFGAREGGSSQWIEARCEVCDKIHRVPRMEWPTLADKSPHRAKLMEQYPDSFGVMLSLGAEYRYDTQEEVDAARTASLSPTMNVAID